eukprot:5269048-Prymnesium_polylepis.1
MPLSASSLWCSVKFSDLGSRISDARRLGSRISDLGKVLGYIFDLLAQTAARHSYSSSPTTA